LAESPRAHSAGRRFLLPGFPYALAYHVFPGVLAVLAVVHVRRRPLYWIGRVR
jgi:hypothetical protein